MCKMMIFIAKVYLLREAAKNVFFNGPATKRGGGLNGVPLRKKELFLK